MLSSRKLILLTLLLVSLVMAAQLLAGYWQYSAVRDLALQAPLERALSSQRLVEQMIRCSSRFYCLTNRPSSRRPSGAPGCFPSL